MRHGPYNALSNSVPLLEMLEAVETWMQHDEEALVPMLMLLPEVVATPPETIAMSADCEMSEANIKPVADMSSTTNVCSRFS